MDDKEKQDLIEKYIVVYNAFDIDGMMSVLHPEITFKNISGGEETASASGEAAFWNLAEQSKVLCMSRKQTIENIDFSTDSATVKIAYEAILAVDLPNGLKAGDELNMPGKTEFAFAEGKIFGITDIS